MEQMGDFFGKQLSQPQKDFYFKDLNYITKDDFEHVIRSLMRGRKPSPANFPTIEDIQAICPREKSDMDYRQTESEMDYYKRIAVTDLWQAFNILEKSGHDQFLRYCKAKNFNEDDVERVEWKHKYGITSGKILKKLAGTDKGKPKRSFYRVL